MINYFQSRFYSPFIASNPVIYNARLEFVLYIVHIVIMLLFYLYKQYFETNGFPIKRQLYGEHGYRRNN